ncbi:MAG: sulfite reductase [Kordiimonas sp.]|nr:sulfite reductase [Kordiimonas sp.]
MYQYDEYDQQIVNQRAAQFRGQVERRLRGEITEDEFRPLRLQNGLYLQLHAYMLRVAIPYGLLSSTQLRKLAYIADTYDKGYGHFTTRQNIQYNWPTLSDMPDILDELASVQMHAIQTSGNCIRNISADQYAGVAEDEDVDPRPYCEIMRQWSTFHPEFAFLGRKFKMAFTGAKTDRAAVQFHDLGYRVSRNAAGEVRFQVIVGGGMGRTPMIGKVVKEDLPAEHLLTYTEAVMRVYNAYGRRDNKYKARIKILVHEMKLDAFQKEVEAEWQQIIAEGGVILDQTEIDRVAAHFTAPAYEDLPAENAELKAKLAADRDFSFWYQQNVKPHKINGYNIVVVSVKKPGIAPGDATSEQMYTVADLADQFSFGELRTTHDQNLVLSDVRDGDLFAVWQQLTAQGLGCANIGTLQDMICCPGLDFCNLANATSIPVALEISDHFDNLDYLYDLGEIQLKISGCINACGHHHVGHIGILGVDKKGVEAYQITLGGSYSDDASVGKILGPAFGRGEIVAAVDRLLKTYVELRDDGERFLDTYRRLGQDIFKERVYANH